MEPPTSQEIKLQTSHSRQTHSMGLGGEQWDGHHQHLYGHHEDQGMELRHHQCLLHCAPGTGPVALQNSGEEMSQRSTFTICLQTISSTTGKHHLAIHSPVPTTCKLVVVC
jgi:hypothetical protein